MLSRNAVRFGLRCTKFKESPRIMAFSSPPELLLRNARANAPTVQLRSVSSGKYRASVVTELGKPMQLQTLDPPGETPEGFVLVDVHHAAVNFADILTAQGKYQEKPPLPFCPGTEFAGVVAGVGPGVSHVKAGDKVLGVGTMTGAFAEKAMAPAANVLPIPAGMSTDVACSLLVTYGTSFMALQRRAGIKPGDTVLVTSAAGGVGLASVDLATNCFGAHVIGACSTDDKCSVARGRGAAHTINYTRESVSKRVKEITGGKGADIIIDNVGGDMFKECLRSVALEGRIVIIGFTSGEIPKIPANQVMLKSCTVMGVYWGSYAKRHPAAFRESIEGVIGAFKAGKMNPHISKIFSLGQTNEAFQFVMDRKSTGKVVIDCRR